MAIRTDTWTPQSKVDWDRVSDLGAVPDYKIAQRFNVSKAAVGQVRKRRGIPPFRTNIRHDIDWDTAPLGKLIDRHVADILGCSHVLVHRERTRRGIPPHGLLYRTEENEGAYYEESIIDLWLHHHNIPHTFQKRLGPYRVDWLLADNCVWEFLGMWDHRLYGEAYRRNFEVKREYLVEQGFTVREIHRSEMGSFKADVDLRAIASMGVFVCRGCGREDVKHHAHALCGTCVGRRAHNRPLGPVVPQLKQGDFFRCDHCGSEDRWKRVRALCRLCYRKQHKRPTRV